MAKTTFKLWEAQKITAQQNQIATHGTKLLSMIRENANQCLAHFKAHGDITLAERLLASLPPGMVVAGLAKWFKDFAPVKFDSKGNATVTGKPDETKLEKALETNWVEDAAVRERANRPIQEPSIAYFKARIAGFPKQVEKYLEKVKSGEAPEMEANPDLVLKWLNGISEFANKLSVMNTLETAAIKSADSKGGNRKAVQAAKKAKNQPSEENLNSETRTGTNG